MKRYLPFIIIAAVLIIAVMAGMSMLRPSQSTSPTGGVGPQPNGNGNSNNSGAATPSASPANYASAAPGADPPHVRGQNNAPVTLEEFGDFQCPPCGSLEPELERLSSDYGPRLRVIFRNFPLPTIHKNAVDAARAAEAAGLQNRFWEMHDMLYAKQGEWGVLPSPRLVFDGYAQRIGLDLEKFKRDMDGIQASSRISSDVNRANSLGVRGTPTIFINGREVPAADMTPGGLRGTIDSALKGQTK